jgi:hypothetical protein
MVLLEKNCQACHVYLCYFFQEDCNDTTDNNSEAEGGDNENEFGASTNIAARKAGIDHFDNEESNPLKSHALGKCCTCMLLKVDITLSLY